MGLIGLEISDAGILAAVGTPRRLLQLDAGAAESPGFALPKKKGLLVGKEAEGKAHLFPRQILNRFWDQLNTEPLEQPGKHVPQNHAEIAYQHIARIWQVIRKYGDEIILVVPDFYDRQQLGLMLGITQELSMDVKGIVPLALAASSVDYPGRLILHLDIHLHRIEIICLKQGDYLTVEDSVALTEKGLIQLYRDWVEAIAQEFVRNTRFDPLHQATSEQALYDRLPGILSHLKDKSSIVLDFTDTATSYNIAIKRDLMTSKAESIYSEVCRSVEKMQISHGNDSAVVLQLSHRLSMLPGLRETLANLKDAQIIELDRGAGAMGVLEIWQQLSVQRSGEGISFFTSRPWRLPGRENDHVSSSEKYADKLPTHLLCRNVAYPITEKPLAIDQGFDAGKAVVRFYDGTAEVSPEHCIVKLRDREVVLEDHSKDGTFVDETRVNGSMTLKLGQIIRLGIDGEQLQLITCLNRDET